MDARRTLPETVFQLIEAKKIDSIRSLIKQNQFDVVNAYDPLTGLTALHVAAGLGLVDIAKLLIDNGAVVSAPTSYGLEETPLYRAARFAHLDTVRMLLERGAIVNTDQFQPLVAAAKAGHLQIVRLLISHGAAFDRWFTPLHTAARAGHLAVVVELIDSGADVNAVESLTGRTPLHAATIDGHHDIMQTLISYGARVDVACSKTGATPLYFAAKEGDAEATRILVKNEADVNAVCRTTGATPLTVASQYGHTDVARILLDAGAMPVPAAATNDILSPLHWAAVQGNRDMAEAILSKIPLTSINIEQLERALIAAVENGSCDVAELLLDNGAPTSVLERLSFPAAKENVNLASILLCRMIVEPKQNNDLAQASRQGNVKMVNELLTAGHPVDKVTSDGFTPLMYASFAGHTDVVELLIDGGADVNATEAKFGATPLIIASFAGRDETVQCLLRLGADVDSFSTTSQTALLMASFGGHLETVRALIDAGADVNATTNDGETSLFVAAAKCRLPIVQLLLEAGGDPMARSVHDLDALNAATARDDVQLIKFLLDSGRIEIGSSSAALSLLIAAQKEHVAIVRLLLECGTDPNTVRRHQLFNRFGITALMSAAMNGHLDVVRVLVDGGAEIATEPMRTDQSPSAVAKMKVDSMEKEDVERAVRALAVDTSSLSALSLAAHNGHFDVVHEILSRQSCFVNCLPALSLAVSAGYSRSARLLLKHAVQQGQVELAHESDDFRLAAATVLCRAVQAGKPDAVSRLLAWETNQRAVNIHNPETGLTALHMAAGSGHADIARLLVDAGAYVNSVPAFGPAATPLYRAAFAGHVDTARLLLDRGARVNTAERQPLFAAAFNGHLDIVRMCIAAGANDLDNPLWIAARNGHLAVVEELLARGANATAIGPITGRTVLHLAAREGRAAVMSKLIERSANVNAVSWIDGTTPLLLAAYYGQNDAVGVLLKHGADPNGAGSIRTTPLYVACQNDHADVAKMLLDAGASTAGAAGRSDAMTPLHIAAYLGSHSTVEALLDRGADFNALTSDGLTPLATAVLNMQPIVAQTLIRRGTKMLGLPEIVNDRYRKCPDEIKLLFSLIYVGQDSVAESRQASPLSLAAWRGDVESVLELLEAGHDVEQQTFDGFKPIMLAAFGGYTEVVKLLAERGANVNSADRTFGMSPLMLAAFANRDETVRELLRLGAVVNCTSTIGQTALLMAAYGGQVETSTALLDGGANVNAASNSRDTPLIVAASKNRLALVRLLLERGASVRAQNAEGFNALHMAAREGVAEGFDKVAAVLLKAGADANASTSDVKSLSPLSIAAEEGHASVVRVLLAHGADPNVLDDAGRVTPLMLAAQNGHFRSVKYLIAHGADIAAEPKSVSAAIDRRAAALDEHLTLACSRGESDEDLRVVVERLIRDGKLPTRQSRSPLYLAAQNGRLDIVQKMLNSRHSFVDCMPALSAAISSDHHMVADALLRRAVEQQQIQ